MGNWERLSNERESSEWPGGKVNQVRPLQTGGRGGRLTSLDASFAQCFTFEEHREKH